MQQRTLLLVIVSASILFGCDEREVRSKESAIQNEIAGTVALEFLTRDGCVNTPRMRESLATAKSMVTSGKLVVTELNQGDLSLDDVKRGYPTPTVLLGGVDLFGLDAPSPPYPPPT